MVGAKGTAGRRVSLSRIEEHSSNPMGYAWTLGIRYLRSKKREFISVGTLFAILGVALGVAALATVMSVTGGFQKQFRDKVLGVNAHVLVLKRTPEFLEYRDIMDRVAKVPGVTGVAPFVINPMLVTAGDKTATGVLMKGIDPDRMPSVLDLPKHIIDGPKDIWGHWTVEGLRRPGAKPPPSPHAWMPTVTTSTASPSNGSGGPSGSNATPPPSTTIGSIGTTKNEQDPFLSLLDKKLQDVHTENEKITKIEEENAEAEAVLAAKGTAASPSASAAPPPKQVPEGTIEPEGGYQSDLPPDDIEDEQINAITKADSLLVADKDLPGVVLGTTLAKSLNVRLGDRVNVTSPAIGFSFSGSTRAPIAKQFRVVAIFEAGFDQYDSKLVYVDLFEAQAFYDQGDSVTGVEMRVSDIDQARAIRDKIEKLLNNGVYHVMDWEELNHPLFTALKIQQIGMSAVLALIIVVAAFTVIATLIMIVLDKRKEIAVLKAMGARDGAILRAFLYQGLIIGGIGTMLGLGIGYGLCKGLLIYGFPLDPKVYFISRLPVEVRPFEFFLTGVVAVLICLAATIVPALNAAAIRPADGLRAQ
jgi:lipoprotein-releasing system permease protein